MSTVSAKSGSSRLAPWMAVSGLLVGPFVADLLPAIGTWVAGVAAGVLAMYLLALLQVLNPNVTASGGSGARIGGASIGHVRAVPAAT